MNCKNCGRKLLYTESRHICPDCKVEYKKEDWEKIETPTEIKKILSQSI